MRGGGGAGAGRAPPAAALRPAIEISCRAGQASRWGGGLDAALKGRYGRCCPDCGSGTSAIGMPRSQKLLGERRVGVGVALRRDLSGDDVGGDTDEDVAAEAENA